MVDQQDGKKISNTEPNSEIFNSGSYQYYKNSNTDLRASSSDEVNFRNSNSTETNNLHNPKAVKIEDDINKHPSAINLDVLKGHKYEIVYKPTSDSSEGNYEYI